MRRQRDDPVAAVARRRSSASGRPADNGCSPPRRVRPAPPYAAGPSSRRQPAGRRARQPRGRGRRAAAEQERWIVARGSPRHRWRFVAGRWGIVADASTGPRQDPAGSPQSVSNPCSRPAWAAALSPEPAVAKPSESIAFVHRKLAPAGWPTAHACRHDRCWLPGSELQLRRSAARGTRMRRWRCAVCRLRPARCRRTRGVCTRCTATSRNGAPTGALRTQRAKRSTRAVRGQASVARCAAARGSGSAGTYLPPAGAGASRAAASTPSCSGSPWVNRSRLIALMTGPTAPAASPRGRTSSALRRANACSLAGRPGRPSPGLPGAASRRRRARPPCPRG